MLFHQRRCESLWTYPPSPAPVPDFAFVKDPHKVVVGCGHSPLVQHGHFCRPPYHKFRLNDRVGVESGYCHCPNEAYYVTGLANHDGVVVSRRAAVEFLCCTPVWCIPTGVGDALKRRRHGCERDHAIVNDDRQGVYFLYWHQVVFPCWINYFPGPTSPQKHPPLHPQHHASLRMNRRRPPRPQMSWIQDGSSSRYCRMMLLWPAFSTILIMLIEADGSTRQGPTHHSIWKSYLL